VAGPDDVGERFSLPAWAERADALLAVLEGATRRTHTDSVAAIPDAFVAGAAALQHLRRDPLLPAALLPSGWPGDALRTAYRAYQPAFAEAVASFFRSSANDGFTDR